MNILEMKSQAEICWRMKNYRQKRCFGDSYAMQFEYGSGRNTIS
jgi:hypothetical protein